MRAGEYLNHEGQVWAEPDLDEASRAMRAVVSDPVATSIRATAGQAFVRQRYSRANVGAMVASRIALIEQKRRQGGDLATRDGDV